ncbi:MAG: ATP-binding cassette domain-containing protein [SAR324 cluster bacterium]|nr:ATP-binding cassette domain-containing protein [SAR324 cluster bacterium]
MQAQSPHLIVREARKRFGGLEALQGVSFEVKRGEVMGLVGDNGAGKSTLMKIIAGAESCDTGQFFLDGNEIFISSPQDAVAQGIRIVYQDLALCENLDVAANLFLGQEPVLGSWAKFLPRFMKPLDTLSMEYQAQQAIQRLKVRTLQSVRSQVGGLSGGQRQAIAIARAIGADSTVVLLDEPTAALGVAQTREVLETIRQLRDTGHAVVYISHNLRDVFEVCDRITVLRQGTNVAIYKVSEVSPEEIVSAMTRGMDVDDA